MEKKIHPGSFCGDLNAGSPGSEMRTAFESMKLLCHNMFMTSTYPYGRRNMAAATERVPVLMTPAEKQRVVSKARKAGLTTGEYMRRAAEGYRPANDDKELEAMIGEMNKATGSAERAIDDALAFVEESNKRIAEMEAKARGSTA
jgi:hypothetical protein